MLIVLLTPLILTGVLLLTFSQITTATSREPVSAQSAIHEHISSSYSPTTTGNLYLPLIYDPLPFDVELLDAWTADYSGDDLLGFHPDENMQYWASGINHKTDPVTFTLQWTQNDPCSSGESDIRQIYSDTISVEPGDWEHFFPSKSPNCSGVFSPIVKLTNNGINQTHLTEFAVIKYSTVFVSSEQGFDKCGLPDVWKMRNWWQNSPYEVFNLYLGGINFGCKSNPLDAVWVRKVAEQGWSFIQTWVGPQAPCYRDDLPDYPRISWDKDDAYQEGRQEAQAAVEASYDLGFFTDRIIYYDMESYGQDLSSCHKAVVSFLSGWTKRLHELGYKSGAYGASCTSFMSEWTKVDPSLDDVWIANWYTNYYDPNASVWNAYCLSNSLWDDHQRLRQYAGGHSETWGDVSITIDSNVLDGEITGLDVSQKAEGIGGRGERDKGIGDRGTVLQIFGVPINNLGLFDIDRGWVLTEGKVLINDNGGEHWQDITPTGAYIISAAFSDRDTGWLVGRRPGSGELAVYRTQDGGSTWGLSFLPLNLEEIASFEKAHIDPLDEDTAWLSLKTLSGSSFSLGRLFYTSDAGNTWHERTIPLGEAVEFQDELHGWVAGGPSGDKLYSTRDGGRTWQLEESDAHHPAYADTASFSGQITPAGSPLPFASFQFVLPKGVVTLDFVDTIHGWAAVQTGACQGDKGRPGSQLICEQHWRLLATDDGGRTWREIKIH
jgi:hypothetical protein